MTSRCRNMSNNENKMNGEDMSFQDYLEGNAIEKQVYNTEMVYPNMTCISRVLRKNRLGRLARKAKREATAKEGRKAESVLLS